MSYKSVRNELVTQSDGMHRCLTCGQSASWETLSNYGARCTTCYESYCRDGRDPSPPLSVEDKLDILAALRSLTAGNAHPKAWAMSLKRRHEAGEYLTPVQRSAYQDAMRDPLSEVIE